MNPLKHPAILLTYIKRKKVLKHNFGLLFEWPLKTDFTAQNYEKTSVYDQKLVQIDCLVGPEAS